MDLSHYLLQSNSNDSYNRHKNIPSRCELVLMRKIFYNYAFQSSNLQLIKSNGYFIGLDRSRIYILNGG